MYYVHVRYSTGRAQVGRQVRYIAHREEQLPGGASRELHGIGERFRGLRGDERGVIHQLLEDGASLKQPRYYRMRLTIDDKAVQRLTRLPEGRPEWVFRDAVEKTFRGALRNAQGVYVLHENAEGRRPFGNPHVHVFLSPVGSDGKTYFIPKRRLVVFKERWEHELNRSLERQERRLRREPGPRGPSFSERLSRRSRGVRQMTLPLGTMTRQMLQGRSGGVVVTAARSLAGLAGRAARLQRDLDLLATTPEGIVKRHAFKLLTKFMPAPLRTSAEFARTITRVIPRG